MIFLQPSVSNDPSVINLICQCVAEETFIIIIYGVFDA